jgi:hypothetical protein
MEKSLNYMVKIDILNSGSLIYLRLMTMFPMLFLIAVSTVWVCKNICIYLYCLNLIVFFERKCGRGSPYSDFGFLKIRTQIRICGDLNLGGWVVHPLP